MRNDNLQRAQPDSKLVSARQCAEHFFEHIPAGVVQVKCNYCEASVLVPPHLGREARQCPNHPDALAVGICNDWGRSFCDRCLYVLEVRDETLYLCSDCYKSRKGSGLLGYGVASALPIVMVIVALVGLANPESASIPPSMSIAFVLLGGLLLLGMIAGAFSYEKKEPLSIHDARVRKQKQEKLDSNGRERLRAN